jgi:sulfoacetaldehyde dehydrogenase
MSTPQRAAVAATDNEVKELMAKARAAQAIYEGFSQEQVDAIVRDMAKYVYDNAETLARMAVDETGLGNYEDKVLKKKGKARVIWNSLKGKKSRGIIGEDPENNLVFVAKPMGVVGAVCPVTNPIATPMCNGMFALKTGNAVIFAPHPKAQKCTEYLTNEFMKIVKKHGGPDNLIQTIKKGSVEKTQELMKAVDVVVATGGGAMVKSAYSSGKPSYGVGAGNVPVIIDETADLASAAKKICASKIFDNATSCSSENSVTIVDAVYDKAIAALKDAGGYMATPEERTKIQKALWVNGHLNRKLIARDADVFAREVGLSEAAQKAKFFMVEETGVGRDHPFSGEKLSLVLTVYRAPDFDRAVERVRAVLEHQGKGHSVGLHSKDSARARRLAETLDVVRVLVNQAHTFGNGGSFDNGLNFTLSMGCGTWQKNSLSENLNYRNFINITHLSTVIPEDKPTEEELFGAYWAKYGK